MKYTREYIASRIGKRGYLEIVAVFRSMGFENVHDVPDMLWEIAVQIVEENMFNKAA